MDQTVGVSPRAAEELNRFEIAIKLEIIAQVERLVEAPAQLLYRPSHVLPGHFVHSFESATIPGLKIMLTFIGFDDEPRRLLLVSVGQVLSEPDEP